MIVVVGVEDLSELDSAVRAHLDIHLTQLENELGTDFLSFRGPIVHGADKVLRRALTQLSPKKDAITILLSTPGGVAEVAERIADTIRHYYNDVAFIILDDAMSAGTILAMSGDRILMDYYSRLGPIDPQVERDGKLIPALGYVIEYEEMRKKALAKELTTADMTLLQKLDLGLLHQFSEAKELSISLLEKWLANYKFKNWKETETSKMAVTQEMRETRAKEIAQKLSDPSHWHSHGRGISMSTLREELNLQIEDFGENDSLSKKLFDYNGLLTDYIERHGFPLFIHARGFF